MCRLIVCNIMSLDGYIEGPDGNPDMADLHLEIGRHNNEIHKVVVSDSPTTDETAHWTETTTILHRRTRTRPSPSSRTGRDGSDNLIVWYQVVNRHTRGPGWSTRWSRV